MDVILHLGAHRTASTSFQRYMRGAAPLLAATGTGFWGPARTRNGLLAGLHDFSPDNRTRRRVAGRLALRLAASRERGLDRLVISDENLIGTPRANLRCAALYPEIGLRMARLGSALGGRMTGVALQIRALDSYWSSLLAFALMRAAVRPDPDLAERIASRPRGWREVITELACALPGIAVTVTGFEGFAAHPDRLLAAWAVPEPPPLPHGGFWANRGPTATDLLCALTASGAAPGRCGAQTGRPTFFSARQANALRARHAADLAWLRAGADGLARFVEDPFPEKAPSTGPTGIYLRGRRNNDFQERRLARPGRKGAQGQTA